MAVVITVAQQKGGAGKTTLAANLAAALAGSKEGSRRVALLDIDPQHSLARWHAIRVARVSPVATITLSDQAGWRLPAELDRLRREHDVVIVDTPPQIDADARRAIRAAALVLIPLQPSPPDLWATEGTLKLAAEEKRPVRMVLNRAPSGGRLRDAMEAALADRGAVLLPPLGNRAAYAQAFAEGLGVTEGSPRSLAAAEMHALVAAVLAAVD